MSTGQKYMNDWFLGESPAFIVSNGHFTANDNVPGSNIFTRLFPSPYFSDEEYVLSWIDLVKDHKIWDLLSFDEGDNEWPGYILKKFPQDTFVSGSYVHVPSLRLAFQKDMFTKIPDEIENKRTEFNQFVESAPWATAKLNNYPAYKFGSQEVRAYFESKMIKTEAQPEQIPFKQIEAEKEAESKLPPPPEKTTITEIKAKMETEINKESKSTYYVHVEKAIPEDIVEVPGEALKVVNGLAQPKLLANDGLWGKLKSKIPLREHECLSHVLNTCKNAPALTREIRKMIAAGEGVSLFSTLATPNTPDGINYFIGNALDAKSATAITHAPSSWSTEKGATMTLSPDRYNNISYTVTRVVDLIDNWKNTTPPPPETNNYQIDHQFKKVFSKQVPYKNLHILPYCRTIYPRYWTLAGPVFQKILAKRTLNVLTSPGPAMLNFKKMEPICYDPFTWKRDTEDSMRITVNPRIEWPTQSIPGQLMAAGDGHKPDVPTLLFPNFACFLKGSSGLFMINLMMLTKYEEYSEKYEHMLEEELQKNKNVHLALENLQKVTRFNPTTKLPPKLKVLSHQTIDSFSKEILKCLPVLLRLSDNQGFVKINCFNWSYLHDYAWGYKYILNQIMGNVKVVAHDDCLFMYPTTAHVPKIDTTTVVPVIQIGKKTLSDGCGLKPSMRKIIAEQFAANKRHNTTAALYFRTLYNVKTGKEDLEKMRVVLLKRMDTAKDDGVVWFVHPVPYNVVDPSYFLKCGYKPIIELLPIPPSYLCPLVIFKLMDPKELEEDIIEESNRITSALMSLSYIAIKTLFQQFYVAPTVINNMPVQNENYAIAYGELVKQFDLFMSPERVEGNAYIPSMKEKNKDVFQSLASTASHIQEMPDEMFADFNI